jgi:hypothetical protein
LYARPYFEAVAAGEAAPDAFSLVPDASSLRVMNRSMRCRASAMSFWFTV